MPLAIFPIKFIYFFLLCYALLWLGCGMRNKIGDYEKLIKDIYLPKCTLMSKKYVNDGETFAISCLSYTQKFSLLFFFGLFSQYLMNY